MKRITFDIKVTVPLEEWRLLQEEGFKETDLPGMVSNMIQGVSECIAAGNRWG